MLGDSKEQNNKKSQNVKRDDIYQMSVKSVNNVKESSSIVGNFRKSAEMEIQIVVEQYQTVHKPEEVVAVEDTKKNEEVLPNNKHPGEILTPDKFSGETISS